MNDQPSLPPLTLADWQAAYRNGALPRPLLAALSRRLDQGPQQAWIRRCDEAMVDARAAELQARLDATAGDAGARAALWQALPLFGVPFAVKDNIDVAGLPTTAACPAFAYTPSHNASVVQKLLDAGAVCMGKTNLDQFATGLVGTRSPYGRPAGTFDATRISGGSSSGSAVVVARGDLPFALGTDTAGSGRVPAGFNHIVGLKPTPGRVGSTGMVPACRSLDCTSVFALTVDDAATVLALIEGPDAGDAYSRFEPGPACFVPRRGAALRIGVPAQPLLDAGRAPAWSQALAQARAQGLELVEMDFAPLHAVAELLYGGPWVAERHAAVQPLLEQAPQAFDPVVRAVIEQALQHSATDAFKGQYRLQAARRDTAALWQQVDLLMVPTAPGHPTFAQIDADPVGANSRLGHYTNFVNLLGWCALALPSGFADGGLPFGVTFIAPADADAALARFGARWQAALALALGATDRPFPAPPTVPALQPASEPVLPLVVVGAHLSGLPLNGQLTERGATLAETTTTAACYRLFALPGTTPPKPALQRVHDGGGAAIAVEVWHLPMQAVGSFLALIPAPLGLGRVRLTDGRELTGFVCEGHALDGATDITAHGGWRRYLAATSPPTAAR